MKKILKTIPYIIIAVLVGVTAVYASSTTSLNPTGSAERTMYTLTDIWNLAQGGEPLSGENEGALDSTPELGLSGKSLAEVYSAVSTALASSGGVDLSNMWNGSSATIDGGTQALGGVDDANYTLEWVTQAPPSNRYHTDWTPCTSGADNYCGTGDAGANAKDEATGLVWSYLCHDIACATWNNPGTSMDNDATYSWDASSAYNDTGLPEGNPVKLTAQELCQSKTDGDGHHHWYLPNQKQLMQAYIDGAYGNDNLEPQGVDRNYWSATTTSGNADSAWYVSLSSGYVVDYAKLNPYNIRCVRE